MPHPPEPHYCFTIPSIHDDTTLDCRIYHPDILSRPRSQDVEEVTKWRKQGIVMAHPYAPMGGSYDDRIVGIVVEGFLNSGYAVGTFNFRGAHGSKGRTSWSGKPELDDYISFAAFFMHYLSYLHPFPASDAVFTPDQSPISAGSSTQDDIFRVPRQESPIVVLGGYSYGSLILKHLPPVPSILQPFAAPLSGSSADEILLRARKLAEQSNLEWINLARDHARRKKTGHEAKLAVTMGGEETSPEKRRSSREIRRSMDGARGLHIPSRLRSLSHRRRKGDDPVTPPEDTVVKFAITVPEIRYLLVSPLTPPVSTLAAPALGPKFWSRNNEGWQDVIGKHKALAIYGDQDIFTSVKRVRDWADKLKSESGSQFSSTEIPGAGHFWVEQGVEAKLRVTLKEWADGIR